MNIIIRNEKIEDYRKTEIVAREAFWNLYFPGCEEHYVIHKMRQHKDFIQELSFVAELDGEIVGSIFYSKSKVKQEDGEEISTISFGPVSVDPKYHRQGIGRKLITHSIELAKEMGYKAIITLGYPYHYKPYGFKGGKAYNIAMEDGKYYIGLLVLPLYKNALNNVKGIALFSEALVVNKKDVEEFDKNFDFKEKFFQDSQKEFEVACSTLDE